MGDAYAYCVLPVELEFGAVVFRPEFDAPHIFHAYQCPIGVSFKDDVLELSRFTETADGAHADLISLSRLRGRLPDLSGGHFDVLFGERVNRIRRG